MWTLASRARGWVTPFQRWHWAFVPTLAIAAYLAVLGVGFLMDDHILLNNAMQPGVDARALLPFPDSPWIFYRPVGVLFTWELGWALWGLNPWPYHLVGLLLHAASALALGLWLAWATGRDGMGWLAGALFGVFPLHLEAVAWISSQWDVLATLLGLLSLWAFTAWWRSGRPRWGLYATSVALYGLAIFTKESLFTFVAVLWVAAWYVSPPQGKRGWGSLGLALLPHVALVGANVGLRLTMTGGLGNYPTARGDFSAFFWDNLLAYIRVLLAPINPAVLGSMWVQVVGAVALLLLLVGLALWGKAQRRLLLVAGVWVLAALLPVLNSPFLVKSEDLQNNRYLYLPAAGYCAGVAALLYATIVLARRWRMVALAFAAGLLALGVGLSWVQLQPWQRASVQAQEITRSLWNLIPPPPQPRPAGMVWYAENVPYAYKGAYMLYVGLGLARVLTYGGGDYPNVSRLPNEGVMTAAEAPLAEGERDAFAFRLAYSEAEDLFAVDYISGVTQGDAMPTPPETGSDMALWDFRSCAPDVMGAWEVSGAQMACISREGLALTPDGDDPQMVGPQMDLRLPVGGFVRLRLSVSYPPGEEGNYRSDWYWHGPDDGFSQERVRGTAIKRDGKSRVYWTFLRADEVGERLSGLRFDPANGRAGAIIRWVVVDMVRE